MARPETRDFRRRLRLALAIIAPGIQELRLLPALLLCAVVGGVFIALRLAGGAAAPVYGAVVGLGFSETDYGSRPYANISVDDRLARVTLPPGSLCRTGDRIALRRSNALLGFRYSAAPSGCVRL